MNALKLLRATSRFVTLSCSNLTKQNIRSLSLFTPKFSEGDKHEYPLPIIVGPGAKPGTIPTAFEQAAGLERLEYIAKLEGVKLFDMDPLYIDHLGTPKDPVIVRSVDENRYVGCTGYPTETHELMWIDVREKEGVDRCPECGCCFRLAPYEYPQIGKILEAQQDQNQAQ